MSTAFERALTEKPERRRTVWQHQAEQKALWKKKLVNKLDFEEIAFRLHDVSSSFYLLEHKMNDPVVLKQALEERDRGIDSLFEYMHEVVYFETLLDQ